MKHLIFLAFDAEQASRVAIANSQAYEKLGEKMKNVTQYVCVGSSFPHMGENKITSFYLADLEDPNDLAALTYPAMLAGASVFCIPVLEMTGDSAQEVERQLRG